MKDGRGRHKSAIAEENRRKVWEFFQAYPQACKIDAERALKLSPLTVRRHARAIRNGWTPEQRAE